MSDKKSVLKKAERHIYKCAPWVHNIDVDVKSIRPEGFKTSIEVKTSRKSIYARKVDSSYEKSIDRCLKAVIKQLKKNKKIRIHRNKERLIA